MYISQRFIAEMNTGGSKTTRSFIPYTNYDFNVRTLINKDLFSKTYAKYTNCTNCRSPGTAMQHESHISNEPEKNNNPESKQNETLQTYRWSKMIYFFTSDVLMLNKKI